MTRVLVVLIYVVAMVGDARGQTINVTGHYTAACCDASNSGPGHVDLVQTGNQISGTYYAQPAHGTISGTLSGNVVNFTWQNVVAHGTGVWRVSNARLDGTWDSSTGQNGTWNLTGDRPTVIATPTPAPPAGSDTAATTAAQPPPAGSDAAAATAAAQPPPAPGPPPKPRIPTTVTLAVKVSPGPYAVNDPITATAVATTARGPRGVGGGHFRWLDPAGTPVAGPDGKPLQFPAKRGPKGTVVATVPPPTGGALTLQYVPGRVDMQADEALLGKLQPAQVTVTIAQCRLRGTVTSPAPNELLAVTSATKVVLEGTFEAATAGGATTLGGAAPIFSVEIDGIEQRVAAKEANGKITAELALQPPATESTTFTVRLLGDGGSNDVCPGATTTVRVTKLGVGLELRVAPDPKGKPKRCYFGQRCPIEARLLLPRDPTARATALSFATAPDLQIAITANGTAAGTLTRTAGDPEGWYTGSFTPVPGGLASAPIVALEAKASSAAQQRAIAETIEIPVREPIELVLPAELDLGTVVAGDGWPAGCAKLDLTRSHGILEESFSLKATEPVGCDSVPALKVDDLGYSLPKGVKVELDVESRELMICVAHVPRCSVENPAPVTLTIVPDNPDFADRSATLKIKWRVTGRSFLACNWWWIAAVAGGLFVLFIGYGFVKPYNFATHDTVKMAADRGKLVRATGRRLRELPGGRSRWYRNAATGLREDGSATPKLAEAAVTLEARKGEVIVKSRGGLQRVQPQSKKLEPYPTGKDGVAASKGIVYVVGNLHFMID